MINQYIFIKENKIRNDQVLLNIKMLLEKDSEDVWEIKIEHPFYVDQCYSTGFALIY